MPPVCNAIYQLENNLVAIWWAIFGDSNILSVPLQFIFTHTHTHKKGIRYIYLLPLSTWKGKKTEFVAWWMEIKTGQRSLVTERKHTKMRSCAVHHVCVCVYVHESHNSIAPDTEEWKENRKKMFVKTICIFIIESFNQLPTLIRRERTVRISWIICSKFIRYGVERRLRGLRVPERKQDKN